MRPDTWRLDDWPLCPACGEDELGDLTPRDRAPTVEDLQTAELYCYRCQRVTVRAGEGARPAQIAALKV